MVRNRRKPIAEINVVPYIDVMLVLLVIFMVTAPLLQTGVEVQLPQATAKPLTEDEDQPIVLSVDVDGYYYLSISNKPKQSIDAQRVSALVAAAMRGNPEATVLVRGDSRVRYQVIVEAMALLQAAGVPQVGLMTDHTQ